METVQQTRKVRETHDETINHIRIADDLVLVEVNSQVNSKQPTISYHMVDGNRWDSKLKTAIKNKRPFSALVEELTVTEFGLITLSPSEVKEQFHTYQAGLFYAAVEYVNERDQGKFSCFAEAGFMTALDGRIDDIYRIKTFDHSVKFVDGRPFPTMQYIENITDEDYHLKELVLAARKVKNLMMPLGDDFMTDMPEIITIPFYNAERGIRTCEVQLFWLPSVEHMAEMHKDREHIDSYTILKDIERLGVFKLSKYARTAEEKKRRERLAHDSYEYDYDYGD